MIKKKLLFFHFDLNGGGAEKVLVNLLNYLDPQKYDITLFLLFRVGCNLKNLKSHVKIKYVFKKSFRGLTSFMKLFPPQILYRFFVRDSYDIEIAYIEFLPTRIIAGNQNLNTKKIAWVHSCKIDIPGVFRSMDEMQMCYSNFDKVVFVSEESKQNFIGKLGCIDLPSCVLPNVMDIYDIQKKALECISEKIDSSEINFCSIGKLEENKGCLRLIECMIQLYDEGIRNWHLFFLGMGSLKEKIEALLLKFGLQNKVTFLGYQTNPYRYLSKMDFFVCPSFFEGYSTSTIESLSLGIPVLTTDCGGMKEILDNGKYGLLVENTISGLKNGLFKFLTDKDLREYYKEMAKIRSTYFDPQNVVKCTEELIDSI